MKRRAALAAAAALAAMSPRAGRAQLPPRRLGVLLFDTPEIWSFLRRELPPALAALGWHEGSNLVFDWRYANADSARLPALAQSLVREGAHALLTRGTPATQALQQATRTVPIVTGVGDPVAAGFAATLAAPGGNITGVSWAATESVLKQLELLREMTPASTRLLVLQPKRLRQTLADAVAGATARAQRYGWVTTVHDLEQLEDLHRALLTARAGERVAALVFTIASIVPTDFAQALLAAHVPAMFGHRDFVEAGGLMSYRLDWENQTRSTAIQLDKVLRGIKPAQIPFELPTRTELVINLRTAGTLGLAVPQALRARADEVVR